MNTPPVTEEEIAAEEKRAIMWHPDTPGRIRTLRVCEAARAFLKQTASDVVERALQKAAVRILDGLTRVLRAIPGSACVIKLEPSGRFCVTIETPLSRISFTGGSVQDACAQAVNTLNADESALVDESAP